MSLEYDLSSIFCPKCQKNNDNLEVERLHIFTDAYKSDKLPYYDIKCKNCDEIFPINTALCLRKAA
jgi:hypothetical protein